MAAPYGFNTLAYRPDMTAPLPSGDPIPGRPGDAAALQGAVQPVALTLTDRDIDAIARVVQSEVGHFYGRGYEDADKAVAAVVDTILNRADSGQFPRSIEGVVNQPLQFSAINDKGSWERLPQASASVRDAVRGHLEARASGAPSSIGGALNFLNPYASGAKALREWGNAVKDNPVGVFGRGRDIHYHGTAPGLQPHEASQISIAGFTPQGRSPIAENYGSGRMSAPARDPALAFAPALAQAPAAQAANAMAFGAIDAVPQLPAKGPDMASRSVGSLPFSARDFGFSRPPGGMDSAGRVTGYANNAFVVPTQSISPESVRGLPQIGTAAPRASAMQPPAAQPARWDDPRNLSAMAAMYGARPAQLGAPILDARAFRPSTNSAPVKNVKPSYNPPRAAAPAPQRAAPARTGGNALTRAVSGVGRAVSAVTSGQAAQAALGVLSGYGGGSVPAGANPSMFAGTGYSWSNPGAYAGGNPYEYAFAAEPFR